MKALIGFAIINLFFIFRPHIVPALATANMDHDHHAKHNMILFGESEIFASHIVYKSPHNFQILLKLNLAQEIKQSYLNEKQKFPNDLFILLLEPMDISAISKAESISGAVFKEASDGTRIKIGEAMIPNADFKLIYFGEVPLDLTAP